MEASAIQVGPGLGRPRITLGTGLLRLRSDQQLVAQFREGNEDAFRVIHDRYRPRLLAYVRQMLPGCQADVEDALQDVFVRAYASLRTSSRELVLRPWLYRVAHNRCVDELRRPLPAPELIEVPSRTSDSDPVAETEQRESLRRLVVDIGRLPEQQRSALLMREMSGMTYADVASALDISIPAVKSLLVRARIGLAQALEARDAACADIVRELAEAHEEGVRPSWMARRHLRDCAGCRASRSEMRVQRRRVAALAPTIGPLAVLAKLFGVGTGAGGGTATAAGAGGATAAGTGGTLTAASGLATVTAGHVATVLAAAVVTAGGAVAVQQTVATPSAHHAQHATHRPAAATRAAAAHETLRMPAVRLAPSSARRHGQASTVRRAPPAVSTSAAAAPARPHDAVIRQASVGSGSDAAAGQATSSTAPSTTCTPPPAACTVSDTGTCLTGSGSTTSSGTQSGGGQTTTTGTTTTTGPDNTGTTGSGTTTGATSGTTSPTDTGTTATTCSATTQSTGTQSTQSSGQTGTAQTGTAQTGGGQTGTGQAGDTQAVKPT